MNPHIQTLFDNLKEGLMIVTPLGKVNYANAAARSIFPLKIGQTLTDEWLSRQITGIRQGYAALPVTSMMEAPSDNDLPDKIEVTLLHSPVGKDLIILAKNTSEENAYENVVSNLAEMLECEFQTPMNQFLVSVSNMLTLFENNTNGNWHLRESLSTVLGMSTVLSEKLRQIGLLASTFKSSQMRGNERIFVHQIIADILTQSASLLHQRRIRVSFAGISEESPVIYGSKAFLTHALTGYLRHLVEKMEIGSNILISLKGKGGFILLSIANDGRGHHPTKHVRQPFLNTPPTKDGIPTIELSLPLCERVLELHGGSIRFSQEGSDLNQITFEIPTGAPAEQSDEHGVEQAQRYAHDLHKLLQNIKQKDRGETK
jgi:signal transduction histidine kinase